MPEQSRVQWLGPVDERIEPEKRMAVTLSVSVLLLIGVGLTVQRRAASSLRSRTGRV